MAEKHLTEDALVILAGRQCPDEIKEAAAAHLANCANCRARLEDTERVYSAWTQILDKGLLVSSRQPSFLATMSAQEEAHFPWKPIVGLLGCCCVAGGVFLLSSNVVPAVRANTILASAVKAEQNLTTVPAYQFSANHEPCGREDSLKNRRQAQLSSSCAEAVSLLRNADWPADRPFAASSYSTWRRGLAHKRDIVSSEPSALRLETLTEQSLVHHATLTLRTSDYRPLSLDLEFADQTDILFTEDVERAPSTRTEAKTVPLRAPAAAAHPIADPLDAAEVQAWQGLDRVGADSGWEAIVVRRNGRIIAEAHVASADRAKELRGTLAQIPMVEADIQESAGSGIQDDLAKRELGGDAPALAHDWLEQQFPDVEERSRYVNRVLDQSKTILGHAFFLERLRSCRRRMGASDSTRKLDAVISGKEQQLREEETSLVVALRPLVGDSVAQPAPPLTYSEAEQLDRALGALLAASGQDDSSSDSELHLVRRLL